MSNTVTGREGATAQKTVVVLGLARSGTSVTTGVLEALGNMNGTVVAIDPTSGRILAMINQKLALSEGAQPCSTIKLAVALAALSEHVIDKDTEIRLGRRSRMNLTEALAHSNNAYFENVKSRIAIWIM